MHTSQRRTSCNRLHNSIFSCIYILLEHGAPARQRQNSNKGPQTLLRPHYHFPFVSFHVISLDSSAFVRYKLDRARIAAGRSRSMYSSSSFRTADCGCEMLGPHTKHNTRYSCTSSLSLFTVYCARADAHSLASVEDQRVIW